MFLMLPFGSVTFAKTTYNSLPYKFEAGTPAIAEVIGLRSALEYVQTIDWDQMKQYKQDILQYATKKLSSIDGLKIIGTARAFS